VEVSQAGAKFPLGQQISRIVAQYLDRNWQAQKKWTPPVVTAKLAAEAAKATPGSPKPGSAEDSLESLPRGTLRGKQHGVYTTLLEMDYEEAFAHWAAAMSSSVEEAVAWNADELLEAAKAGSLGAAKRPSGLTGGAAEDGFVKAFKSGKKSEYRHETDPAKVLPYDAGLGWLNHVADYVRKRIPTSCDYCVLCDKPHVFKGGAMLKSSVCSRDLCVFAFQELSVGSDSAETIATDGGVVDLLINIFKAAAFSNRADTILTPFPHVFDPKNPSKAVLDPKSPDTGKVKKILEGFPSVKDVVGSDSLPQLKAKMSHTEPLAFPLLEWIINSNRSMIIKMDKAHILPSLKTPHQYLLMTAPPEKQRKFLELKKQHGTTYAFHGSGMENWHAILRNGLKNASGTKLQVNGAAHGSGIYFATNAGTSIGYCRPADVTRKGGSGGDAAFGKDQFISESNMICLAVAEIVKDGIKDHGWCWTVADEDRVQTRFFCVYDASHGSDQATGAETKNDAFRREIEKCLKFHNMDLPTW